MPAKPLQAIAPVWLPADGGTQSASASWLRGTAVTSCLGLALQGCLLSQALIAEAVLPAGLSCALCGSGLHQLAGSKHGLWPTQCPAGCRKTLN